MLELGERFGPDSLRRSCPIGAMLSLHTLSTSYTMTAGPRASAPRAAAAAMAATSDEYTIAVLGDLHLDPRDLDHSHP